jgi:heme exporter protein A
MAKIRVRVFHFTSHVLRFTFPTHNFHNRFYYILFVLIFNVRKIRFEDQDIQINKVKIVGDQIAQKFNDRAVFKGVSFEVESGSSLVLAGSNGSGKTTLIRIICRLIRPSRGSVKYFGGDTEISHDSLYPVIGLVGPYLQLYNNLTALENYTFFAKIRGLPVDIPYLKNLMEKLGLQGRELDELRTYSSGMLQRVKYVMALLHQPHVLILDEPTSNLDEKGAEIVYEIMESQKKDKILIVATNDPGEFRFGDEQIRLNS